MVDKEFRINYNKKIGVKGGRKMGINKPRGTNDILPDEAVKWVYIEKILRKICAEYGYQEIRTPIFEHTELFQRGVGETTDVVEKEMYTFTDRGDRSMTLRPECTASITRAYLENKMHALPQPNKLFYIGPMFRYDRPQAGRYRQFHQFGIESLGAADPMIDAEIIALVIDLYQRLGLTDLAVHLNSVGCPKCRAVYREKLIQHLRDKKEYLCEDCQSRLERNPLRVLDCKSEKCKEYTKDVPSVLDSLCEECADHLEGVKAYLDELSIPYELDPKLVRGLDYYTKTAFEIIYSGLGAQSTVCGGGRYDGLIKECGGADTPAVGCAMGLERLLLTLEKKGIDLPKPESLDVFIAPLGETAKKAAFSLMHKLRRAGLKTVTDYFGRSLKAQLKQADKRQAAVAVILGEAELEKGEAIVRVLATGEQEEAAISQLTEVITAKLKEEKKC